MDREYGIYNDIFLDTCDIHKRASSINQYGPVLFKINLDILSNIPKGELWITKDNPTNWYRLKEEEYWFKNCKEVGDYFGEHNFQQMLVIRKCKGKLPLNNYLEEVILDNPKRKYPDNCDLMSYSRGALKLAYALGPLPKLKFINRDDCSKSCSCSITYKNWDKKTLKKFFSPMAS